MKKILLITGGSRGIGAATAIKAAAKGYSVCINYRENKEAAEEITGKIKYSGGEAINVQADISVENDVVKMFKMIDEKLGPVNALVNNAGILEQQTTVSNMDAARLARVLGVNVIGSFICAREAIKRMSTQNGGSGGVIINISSGASKFGAPFEYVDYAASKGAIDSFTIGLAKETAQEGIRVNAVRPGIIDTEIHASGGEPNRIDRVKAMVPMNRAGTAEEAANAILWLLSDEASYVSGAILDVGGGR